MLLLRFKCYTFKPFFNTSLKIRVTAFYPFKFFLDEKRFRFLKNLAHIMMLSDSLGVREPSHTYASNFMVFTVMDRDYGDGT